jgi:hypothetical protein
MSLSEWKKELLVIFKKVKDDVKQVLNLHRKGLALTLADMGISRGVFIGGMHFHPGNEIVMNKSLLRIILEKQPYEIVWAYTYHILLKLYLQALGLIHEEPCREATLKVSRQIFKDPHHPAIIMAEDGIESFIPDMGITYIPPDRKPDGMPIEYIPGSDKEEPDYYS